MTCIAAFLAACALWPLTPLRPDTPPPLPIPVYALDYLKTEQDVVNASVLSSGVRAPADLVLPQLLNRRETIEYVLENYPPRMRDSSNTGRPFAWMLVDERGHVNEASYLVKPSGHASLDSLALDVLRVMRFAPALVKNQPVAVWLPYPVHIASYRALADALKQPSPPEPGPGHAPYFTPYTVPPRLRNRDEVRKTLVRLYPAELRQLHVAGTTMVWAFVDKKGAVVDAQVRTSSGYDLLDRAAVNVALLMRFSPALNGTKPVDVWIQLPIVFKAE